MKLQPLHQLTILLLSSLLLNACSWLNNVGEHNATYQLQFSHQHGISDAAVTHTAKVLENRLGEILSKKRFAVTPQANRQISVQLMGIDDPEAYELLLTTKGELGFYKALQKDSSFAQLLAAADAEVLKKVDAYQPISTLWQEDPTWTRGAVLGLVEVNDTAALNKYLNMPEVQAVLLPGWKLLYSKEVVARSSIYDSALLKGDKFVKIHGIECTSTISNCQAEITQQHLTSTKQDFDYNQQVVISLKFNAEGAAKFAKMTAESVNKPIAIVINQQVYSAPIVMEAITGGNCQITGDFTPLAANILSHTLMSERLPQALKIVDKQVVKREK